MLSEIISEKSRYLATVNIENFGALLLVKPFTTYTYWLRAPVMDTDVQVIVDKCIFFFVTVTGVLLSGVDPKTFRLLVRMLYH